MDQSDDFLIISSVAYILSILDLLPLPGCTKVYFRSGGGFDLLHPSDRFLNEESWMRDEWVEELHMLDQGFFPLGLAVLEH